MVRKEAQTLSESAALDLDSAAATAAGASLVAGASARDDADNTDGVGLGGVELWDAFDASKMLTMDNGTPGPEGEEAHDEPLLDYGALVDDGIPLFDASANVTALEEAAAAAAAAAASAKGGETLTAKAPGAASPASSRRRTSGEQCGKQ